MSRVYRKQVRKIIDSSYQPPALAQFVPSVRQYLPHPGWYSGEYVKGCKPRGPFGGSERGSRTDEEEVKEENSFSDARPAGDATKIKMAQMLVRPHRFA